MTALRGTDAVHKALEEIAKRVGGGSVSTGFMSGPTYEDGTPVAAVAFWNEFGDPAKGRPPRAFFRQMIAKNSDEWPATMAAQLRVQNYDGQKVLAIMGEEIKAQLTTSIIEFTEPKLSPITAARKGFDKRLIDTAHMKNSITYEVTE